MHFTIQKTALGAAISLCLSPAVLASDARTLDTVQVTASRVERPLDESLASVTVIRRADIEASQAPDLLDLLGRQVGVDIARTGGPGGGSAVFLRGGNSNHSLVLVDGIRVTSTGQGVFDFAHLPLEQIERIAHRLGTRCLPCVNGYGNTCIARARKNRGIFVACKTRFVAGNIDTADAAQVKFFIQGKQFIDMRHGHIAHAT